MITKRSAVRDKRCAANSSNRRRCRANIRAHALIAYISPRAFRVDGWLFWFGNIILYHRHNVSYEISRLLSRAFVICSKSKFHYARPFNWPTIDNFVCNTRVARTKFAIWRYVITSVKLKITKRYGVICIKRLFCSLRSHNIISNLRQ